MLIDRRAMGAGFAALLLASCAGVAKTGAPDPLLRLVERGKAKVYVFGFAPAKDESWLTPKVERALAETTELWIETPPPDPNWQAANSPAIAELGYDRRRDLFEVLPPELSARTLAYAQRLDVTRERLAPMKPWLAREAIQRAWAAKNAGSVQAGEGGSYPDQVIIARMTARGVSIRSEYATIDDVLRGFGTLSEQGQFEYLTNLLDFFDGADSGANDDVESWVYGRPSERLILEQKAKTPALYAAMHFERNKWWAEKIESFLSSEGVRFCLVGLNHALGPDSIPKSLERRGVSMRLVRA